MSFSDDINKCMSSSGLPTLGDVYDSLTEAIHFVDELYDASENSGLGEMTLEDLVNAGVAYGPSVAVLATAASAAIALAPEVAAITVGAYLLAYVACIVSVAGSSIWDEISSPAMTSDWIRAQLKAQAEAQNVPDFSGALPPDDPFS